MGRVKGIGGSWAGRMRCAREGRADSRRRAWVAGVSEDGGGGDRAQQGSMMIVVVVGIVRFQRGEEVGVRKARGW